MEKVRAMLFDSKLGEEHWAEATLTATYVKNKSPSSHNAVTPCELLYGKKSDVSDLRVFGAMCGVIKDLWPNKTGKMLQSMCRGMAQMLVVSMCDSSVTSKMMPSLPTSLIAMPGGSSWSVLVHVDVA